MIHPSRTQVILAAFGTTRGAKDVKRTFLDTFSSRFPTCDFHWTVASRFVRKSADTISPTECLARLVQEGHRPVIQSLHVTCGSEFHRLVAESRAISDDVEIGLPLLASRDDCEKVAERLLSEAPVSKATVLIAHGTKHPAGIFFHQVGERFAAKLGDRGFYGMIEGDPDRNALCETIRDSGFKKVHLLPMTLVSGVHFTRDLMGEEDSWKTAFQAAGISVTADPRGVGLHPGIVALFGDHLAARLTP